MKMQTKKLLLLLCVALCASMCLAFTGCGDESSEDSSVTTETTEGTAYVSEQDNFDRVSPKIDKKILKSRFSKNEMLTNLTVDSDWYDEDDEGYVTINSNLTEEAYSRLDGDNVSSEDMTEYEKLLMDMNKYCFDISQKYEKKDCGTVHVYFYVFPPGKGQGSLCFSYVTDEGIESDPFGYF